MVSSDIVDSNSLIRGRIDKIDFEILFQLVGNRKTWHRKIVDDRVKVELKAWISRYIKREIWMYERAFKKAITRTGSDSIRAQIQIPCFYSKTL